MFTLNGGYDDAVAFINSLELASHLANVGVTKTLVILPLPPRTSSSAKRATLSWCVAHDGARVRRTGAH